MDVDASASVDERDDKLRFRSTCHQYRKSSTTSPGGLDDTLNRLHNTLREQVRQVEGRSREPSAALGYSQTVRGAGTVPCGSRGYDSGTKAMAPSGMS